MSVSGVNRSPVVMPVRTAPAVANAPRPAVANTVRAAAAPAPGKPGSFKDLESYKAYVLASEATQLPAARAAVAEAQGKLDVAKQALAARRGELGSPELERKLAESEAALELASFPLRPAAKEKRAEAARITGQSTELAKQIARAQSEIARAEGRSASRNRDIWFGDDRNDDGWSAVGDLIGAIGDSATISQAKKRIAQLVDQKATLDQQVLNLTIEATAMERQPGEAGTVAAARKTRDDARAAVDAAKSAAGPQQQAVDEASARLNTAQGELGRLESFKKELTDYDKQFGFFTRTQLKLSNWGWRKELDAFWQSKGL